jgi:hypothetical protein
MNAIVGFFVRVKHWQLFLLFLGGLFIGQIAIFISFATAAQSPEDLMKPGLLLGGVMILFMYCFLGWFWSMGFFLSSLVSPSLRLRMGFFRFALAYPAVYVFALIAFFRSPTPTFLASIFPFHLFAMFCMFYSLYFVSKSLVLAETGKLASFYDYAGPFFLLWFFPIGVWIIQPRINRLYDQNRSVKPITGANVS